MSEETTRIHPQLDDHYEEEFEFELWRIIQDKAEELNCSYEDASVIVLPEWMKGIRYRDTEFEDALINKRRQEMLEVSEHERRLEEMIKGGKK